VACRDFVEQVTDHLDDALAPADREAVDRHLAGCPDCARALAQWREVVVLTGRLADHHVDRLDPATRADLLAAFRARPPDPHS
jgi:anti-sigma factor RsiW